MGSGPGGYRGGMADPTRARRRALLLVVVGILVLLGVLLMIGIILGDDTDEIDPQNGDVVTTSTP
jgi:hypothetical protein